MSLLFQLDEHLDHEIARQAQRQGVDIVTASDAGVRTAPDETVLASAVAAGRVLVTFDHDFVKMHNEGRPHTGIVYCPTGARTIGQIVTGILILNKEFEPGHMINRLEYLRRPRR